MYKKKVNNFQKGFFSKDFLIVFGFHWFFLQLLLQQLYIYRYMYIYDSLYNIYMCIKNVK